MVIKESVAWTIEALSLIFADTLRAGLVALQALIVGCLIVAFRTNDMALVKACNKEFMHGIRIALYAMLGFWS